MLSSAGVVADCSLHRTSAIQDLQVLAGTQQRSAPLELWQIVPYTTDLPSRTCRSWKELSSAGPVADCSLHCTSAIQDLQVLEGAQQRSAALELWQIAPSPRSCHPGPAGPGRSSTVLSAAGAVADCSLHHRSAIQDLQVLEGAQQRSAAYTAHLPGVVADCSLHRTSAIQDLQVLAGAQQRSALLELWQIVPYTTDLPSRTSRSWQELSSTGAVADCSLHRSSAIQDLQVLTGDQKVLGDARAMAESSPHHKSAIQDL